MGQYCELTRWGAISFKGDDAVSFLHAQLTSDVAALGEGATQYTGYCTPKGRLLATGLLWRLADEILLLVPTELRDGVQARLSKYILRSKVKAGDAGQRFVLAGVIAGDAEDTLKSALAAARLADDRQLLLVAREKIDEARSTFATFRSGNAEDAWALADIAAGVPVITPATQEEYVPQMVNLDLIGAVSYSKGCYPGQEIVARTHYLGRLKQRTYRIAVPGGITPQVGDRLYSEQFGNDQASGAILNAAVREDGAAEALAVVQTAAVARGLHYGSLEGPLVEFLPLPYEVSAAV